MIRRPGRPPLDRTDRSVEMCLTIPSKKYDDLYAQARAERVTVPEVIRRVLRASAAVTDKGRRIT